MSVGAITNSLLSSPGTGTGTGASSPGGAQFVSAISDATGQAGAAAASTAASPFNQMGTDLQSFLVQLGDSGGEAKDTSATTASANSTAGLHAHGHGHHHDGQASEGSGDLATDFANDTIN